jgi:DNA-binding response OmpR family regulator
MAVRTSDDPHALVLAPHPLAAVVARELEGAGMTVVVHDRPDGALKAMYEAAPSLIILAAQLGEVSGVRLLRGIRELADTPVFIIGRRNDEAEVAAALDAGGDDYVVQPLRRLEFVARARALIRRRGDERPRPSYRDALLEVDFENVRVRVGGDDVVLTPVEYRLLRAFVRSPNQVLSVEQLLERVWSEPGAPSGRVKLYVGYLREKLRAAGAATAIETVRGFGYRYVPQVVAGEPTSAVDLLDAELQAELDQLRGPRGQPFFANEAARREFAEALARA